MFEIFEHTADVGIRVQAETREGLFADAAAGLFSVIVADLGTVRSVLEVVLRIEGVEVDYLLFDWLSELLYTYETQHVVLREFEVQIDDAGLSAVCRGEAVDPDRHELIHEVKAITYHRLDVKQLGGRWQAEVILDI